MLVVETAHSLNASDPTTLLGHDHKEPNLTLCRWVYHMRALDDTMADMRQPCRPTSRGRVISTVLSKVRADQCLDLVGNAW
jgi:hypothetical protein